MIRYAEYLIYVLCHKLFVWQEGRKLGLSRLMLLIHDWDKFLPREFIAYARTFYTPKGDKQYVMSYDFAKAWMKHQHRNKHHWQYWLNAGGKPLWENDILVWDKGNAVMVVDGVIMDYPGEITIREAMPEKYVLEMLADWRGAGRAITGKDNTDEWYLKNKDNMKLHPDTRAWIEKLLGVENVLHV